MTATRWPSGNAVPLPIGTNLNTIITDGYYDLTNPVNGPGTGRWRVHVEVDANDDDVVLQTATKWDGPAPLEFIRRRNAVGVWDAWYSVATIAAATDVDTTARADGETLFYDAGTGKHIYAYASPKSPDADLRDFITGDIVQYGGTPGSGTDITPGLNAALAAVGARYGARGTVWLPPGYLRMGSGVDPASWAGNFIRGRGRTHTNIAFDAASGTAFHNRGKDNNTPGAGANRTGGGLSGFNIVIGKGRGNTTAFAIRLEGDDATNNTTRAMQPSYMEISNIQIGQYDGSADANWFVGLRINGTVANGAGGGTTGIRQTILRDINIFGLGAGSTAADFYSAAEMKIDGLQSFGASGANILFATAGGVSNADITVLSIKCSGALRLYNTDDIYIDGRAADVQVNTTATYARGNLRTPLVNGATYTSPLAVASIGANSTLRIFQ